MPQDAITPPFIRLQSSSKPKYASAIASSSIPLGSSLLAHPPLVAIPLEDEKPLRCSQCLLSAENEAEVVLCERCRCESYCSYTCKAKAWSQHHSRLCTHLPAVQQTLESKNFLESTVHAGLLLLRLVGTYFYEESKELTSLSEVEGMSVEEIRNRRQSDAADSSRIETFFELLPRPLDKEEEAILNIIADRLGYLSKTALRFLLERFSGNNHVISDERLRPIGHAILPEISRACNHSCAPSGVISTRWNGQKQEIEVCVKTLRPLQADEELTIPYLDPILPLQQRQTFLQQRYGFTCACPLCTYQLNLKQSTRDRLQPHPEDLTQLYQLVVGKGISSAISRLRSLHPVKSPAHPTTKLSPSDMVKSSLPLPSRVSFERVPQALHYCFDTELVTELTGMFAEAGEKGEWRVAYMAGLHVLGVYVPVYGWRYPLVALHLLELAKIIHNAHLSSDSPSSKKSPPELLLQATVYLSWAKESLACTVAEGGDLAGEGAEGGPRAEVGMLRAALEDEWKFVLS